MFMGKKQLKKKENNNSHHHSGPIWLLDTISLWNELLVAYVMINSPHVTLFDTVRIIQLLLSYSYIV